MLLCLLLGFALRAFGLAQQSVEGDEAFSANLAGQGLAAIVRLAASQEPHPPLYYALLHGWIALAGWTEFSIRFPSLLCGVALVAVGYRLGARLFGRPAGAATALLLAISPFQVWYAQTARMYAMLALFSAWSVWLFLRLSRRSGRASWAGYLAVTLLALYAHYYGLFVAAFENGVTALRWWRGRPAPPPRAWMAAQVALAAGFVPWLVMARQIALAYQPVSAEVDYARVAWQTLLRFGVGSTVGERVALWTAPLFLALPVLGLLSARGHRGPALLAAGYLAAPFVLALLASLLFRPLLATRYLIVASPAYALLLARGLERLRPRPLGALALLVVVALSLYSWWNAQFDERYGKGHARDLIAHLAAHARPADAVVLDGLEQADMFRYYRHRYPGAPEPFVFPQGGPITPASIEARLAAISGDHAGLWLSDAGAEVYDPGHEVERWLTAHAHRAFEWKVGYNRLVYFVGGAAPGRGGAAPQAVGPLRLEALRVPAGGHVGEALPIDLRWQGPPEMLAALRVSLRLMSATGEVVASRDHQPGFGLVPPDGGALGDRAALVVPDDAAPGRYALRLVAYDAATGRPFAGAPQEVPLGDLNIERPALLPPLEDVATRHSLAVDLAPGLRLIGLDLDRERYRAGARARLRLVWQARAPVAARTLSIALGDGQPLIEALLGPTGYPAARWLPGEIVAMPITVRLPLRLASGRYPLRLTVTPGATADAISLIVEPRPEPPAPFIPERRLEAQIGSHAQLVGFSLAPQQVTAETRAVEVRLLWRALDTQDEDYAVFVHLVSPDGAIVAQHDAQPPRPTSEWLPGDFIDDTHRLDLKRHLAPGHYALRAGMYTPRDGQRLPAAGDPAGSLPLGWLEVQ